MKSMYERTHDDLEKLYETLCECYTKNLAFHYGGSEVQRRMLEELSKKLNV